MHNVAFRKTACIGRPGEKAGGKPPHPQTAGERSRNAGGGERSHRRAIFPGLVPSNRTGTDAADSGRSTNHLYRYAI
jgi:hypothetical protein